ncbi:hypothetical protein HanRHA438_Chr17g0839661 [Helianthus annuus]|nr:hypothetical protein HanRHA438_Chr17g0839661 [Helianthus annuus]
MVMKSAGQLAVEASFARMAKTMSSGRVSKASCCGGDPDNSFNRFRAPVKLKSVVLFWRHMLWTS